MERGFSDHVLVKQVPNIVEWRVYEDISYYITSDEIAEGIKSFIFKFESLIKTKIFKYKPLSNEIVIFKGFTTDFASSPRFLWPIVSPADIRRPAIFHDALMRVLWALKRAGKVEQDDFKKYRKIIDDLFYEAMLFCDPKIKEWKRWSAYKVVRIFGGSDKVARIPPFPVELYV